MTFRLQKREVQEDISRDLAPHVFAFGETDQGVTNLLPGKTNLWNVHLLAPGAPAVGPFSLRHHCLDGIP